MVFLGQLRFAHLYKKRTSLSESEQTVCSFGFQELGKSSWEGFLINNFLTVPKIQIVSITPIALAKVSRDAHAGMASCSL